jgi:hypothetical protein
MLSSGVQRCPCDWVGTAESFSWQKLWGREALKISVNMETVLVFPFSFFLCGFSAVYSEQIYNKIKIKIL